MSQNRQSARWHTFGGLLVAAALVFVVMSCGNDLPTKQAVVDAFEAPADWREITHPNYSGVFREGLCIGTLDCRVSVTVQWELSEKPSPALLQEIAEAEGWTNLEYQLCDNSNRGCWLDAKSGGVDVDLSYRREARWVVQLSAG